MKKAGLRGAVEVSRRPANRHVAALPDLIIRCTKVQVNEASQNGSTKPRSLMQYTRRDSNP